MPIIASIEDLENYVNQIGECLVYPDNNGRDITSLVAEGSLAERRQRALQWAESLHLAKKLFLCLAAGQQYSLFSWQHFVQVYPRSSNQYLNLDEDGLLGTIRGHGAGTRRALLQASGMPAGRFTAALNGLQMKMLVTFCGAASDEDGRPMECFDLTDNWLPDEFGI